MTDENQTDTQTAERPGSPSTGRPRRVVVVGSGFAGYFACRKLRHEHARTGAIVELVSDTDALLYQPLLPNVAIGRVDPRTIAVPLVTTLPGVRVLRGRATAVDLTARTVSVASASGRTEQVHYDTLVLCPGGVTKLVDIPGLAERAIGFKTVAEALFLRDHVLGRLEAANEVDDPTRRRALLTFVVVGAGYAGTELVAQMIRLTNDLRPLFTNIGADEIAWLLLDVAPAVMPELGKRLGDDALALLKRRGVDVRLETSLKRVGDLEVELTDGTTLPCSTVVWCAGVTANPLISRLGLATTKGRLDVGADLSVPGHSEVYAVGDAAAVPDLTADRDDDGHRPLCPPTAQHAMRQGAAVARNIKADLRSQPRQDYEHHDLGLVVDLGGVDAVARPLGQSLSGPLAKLVTAGYHWYALPTVKRRIRLLADWAFAGGKPDDVSFGMVPREAAEVEHAED